MTAFLMLLYTPKTGTNFQEQNMSKCMSMYVKFHCFINLTPKALKNAEDQ